MLYGVEPGKLREEYATVACEAVDGLVAAGNIGKHTVEAFPARACFVSHTATASCVAEPSILCSPVSPFVVPGRGLPAQGGALEAPRAADD